MSDIEEKPTSSEIPPEKALAVRPESVSMSGSMSGRRSWWNKAKRRALELVLEGTPDTAIAQEVKVNVRTIYRWKRTSVFMTALHDRINEHGLRLKLKRIRETGALTDALAQKAAKKLTKDVDEKDNLKALPFLAEYRAMREQERLDFGDHVKKIEIDLSGHIDSRVERVGGISFKKFLETNKDVINVDPSLPQDKQMAEAALQLVQRTDILDHLHEESVAEERMSREEADKKK